ncbi:MAG: transporter substrate-binding domain-containing protein [Betaproteobacteria bacterium]|nr:transporter substrate-binding domain-containing protein [Betaproteobacteria bacterium]
MKKSFRVPLLSVALPVSVPIGNAQRAPDTRVENLVRAGRVRVALFPSFMYTKDPVSGELRGVVIEIARALGARLGVEVLLVEYPTPPKALESLKAGASDVTFMGLDPTRSAAVDFSLAFMQADFTYLVPAGSSIRRVLDADQLGVCIAIVRNHAMDFALRGILKHAESVYAENPDAGFDLLRTRRADVLAGIRPGLLEYATQLPGSRVLEDCYGANSIAMAVPKGQGGWFAYVSEFIEEAKASGLVERAIVRAGLRGVQAVPPGNSNARK